MSHQQRITDSQSAYLPAAATRFCWHDLMTTDLDRARAFYVALFGWELREIDLGPGGATYPMIFAGDHGVGGMVQLRGEETSGSQWLGYVSVPDVDALCTGVPSLGGTVAFGPMDVPDVGRFAVVADPDGARLAPIALSHPDPEPVGAAMLGTVAWNELLTHDPAGAAAFYERLFGWSHATMDLGEQGPYWLLRAGETDRAGIMPTPRSAEVAPMWMPYFAVADVDAAARHVAVLGGSVLLPPADIPNVGRFSVALDPTGAVFALYRGAAW